MSRSPFGGLESGVVGQVEEISVPPRYVFLGCLLGASTLFVGLRLYVRLGILKTAGLDDLALVLALATYAVYIASSSFVVRSAIFLLEPTLTQLAIFDAWSSGTKFWFISELFFVLSTTLVRIACAMTLLRIIPRRPSSRGMISSRTLRWTILVPVAITSLYSAFFFFIYFFQCQPVPYFWTYMIPGSEGKCINDETVSTPYTTLSILFAVHAMVSAVCDWILGVVPFFVLWHLQMRRAKKVWVCVLLSLGIIAGILAIVRTIDTFSSIAVGSSWDSSEQIGLTTALEPALGLTAISSVCLMPLLRKINIISPTAHPYPSGAGVGPAASRGSTGSQTSDNGNVVMEKINPAKTNSSTVSTSQSRGLRPLSAESDTEIIIDSRWAEGPPDDSDWLNEDQR